MDINSPIGKAIYRSIEHGNMVPTETGFYCRETGWSYDVTNMDYFVRRKPDSGQLERIYLGMSETLPVPALDAGEQLQFGTSATCDELLSPVTLPKNVSRNVRPHTWHAQELLEACQRRGYDVFEHDPGKWPYFVRPAPRGCSPKQTPSAREANLCGWPINHTRQRHFGVEYGAPSVAERFAAAPPPYPADEAPGAPAPFQDAAPRTAAGGAQAVAVAPPYQRAALAGVGITAVATACCLVGAAVGFVVDRTMRALRR